MAKCDICGKRDARYYRIYSGHKLCTICLERILARTVKRTISKSGVLSRGSKILAVIRPSDPMHSLASLLLLSLVESRFNVEIIILIPDKLYNNILDLYLNKIKQRVKTHDIVEKFQYPKTTGLIHCIRYERAWALNYARELDVDAIAYPFSRTCINLIGLEALLSSRIEALSETLPVMTWTDPPIFSPIADIEGEAISAYAFLKGAVFDPICINMVRAKIPLLSILGGRPELEFSSTKTIINIARKINAGRCKVCGGYVYGDSDICRFCIESGASRFVSRSQRL